VPFINLKKMADGLFKLNKFSMSLVYSSRKILAGLSLERYVH